MADETTTTEGGQQPPVIPPQGNNADLVKQLTQTTQELTQAKAQLDALTKERDGLKTGLDQTTAKVTDLEKKFGEASTALQTKTGEVATLSTQLQQTLGQVTELTNTNTGLTKQVDLFNVIANKPEFHPMVGSFQKLSEVIKPDAPQEAIEALLGTMAADAQKSVTSALEIFRAGGSPAANHGTETVTGPKTKEEAWSAWQAALKAGDNAKQQVAYQAFVTLTNDEGKQTA